ATRRQEQVPVLQVAVGHARAPQLVDQLGEPHGLVREGGPVPQVRLDPRDQRCARGPVHLQHRPPLAPHVDAPLLQLEADLPRSRDLVQMLDDRVVPLSQIVEPSDEAAHGPAAAVVPVHPEHAGEVAAHRAGEPEGRALGRGRRQVGVGEARGRVLERVEVARARGKEASGGARRGPHSTSIRTRVTSSLRRRLAMRSWATHSPNASRWVASNCPSCFHGVLPVSVSSRNQWAMASVARKKVSPERQSPSHSWTWATTRSKSSGRLGTRLGDDPKSLAVWSGKQVTSTWSRTWNRHVSPMDTAVHPPALVSCRPSNVANAPWA